VQYENPESLRLVFRKSAHALLGRRLSNQEENQMITAFQSQHVGAQRARYAATGGEGGGGPGGAYTTPETAEEFAETQLYNRPEAGAQRYIDAFGEVVKSLGVIVEKPGRVGSLG
jgi:hypothetical protein